MNANFFRKQCKAYILIEFSIVLLTIAIITVIILTGVEVWHRTLSKSSAVLFLRNIDECKSLAALSQRKSVEITFRPVDGPYTSYNITSDIQKIKTVIIPEELRFIDKNGLLKNHTLRVNEVGEPVDSIGNQLISPDPGIISIINSKTDRVYNITFKLKKGKLTIE